MAEPSTSRRFSAAVGTTVFIIDREQSEPLKRLSSPSAVTALSYAPSSRVLCASAAERQTRTRSAAEELSDEVNPHPKRRGRAVR